MYVYVCIYMYLYMHVFVCKYLFSQFCLLNGLKAKIPNGNKDTQHLDFGL